MSSVCPAHLFAMVQQPEQNSQARKGFAAIRLQCLEVKSSEPISLQLQSISSFLCDHCNSPCLNSYSSLPNYVFMYFTQYSHLLFPNWTWKRILQVRIWKLEMSHNLHGIKACLSNSRNGSPVLTVISLSGMLSLFCLLDKFLHIYL